MALTDAKLRGLKGKPAPYKVSDSEGLHVLVSPRGSKLWRWAYRVDGRQRTLALGKYPIVTLLDARRARDAAKQLLLDGTDPSDDRRDERRRRSIAVGNTFEAVANEWFENNHDRWVESYSSRLRSRLDDDLLPTLGQRPIVDIEPSEILGAIRTIEQRGAIEMAKRVMQMASAIFCYAVATTRCRQDPTVSLRGALKPANSPKRRTALPATELPKYMAELQKYAGDAATKLALKLIAMTFVRTAELRFARWSELEGLDSREPLWRISDQEFLDRTAAAGRQSTPIFWVVCDYPGCGSQRARETMAYAATTLGDFSDCQGVLRLCQRRDDRRGCGNVSAKDRIATPRADAHYFCLTIGQVQLRSDFSSNPCCRSRSAILK